MKQPRLKLAANANQSYADDSSFTLLDSQVIAGVPHASIAHLRSPVLGVQGGILIPQYHHSFTFVR